MANIRSQIKRNRQNEKRRLRNRDFRGAARTAVKDALASITSGQETPAAVMAAISALDHAARKGAIHHRNAARRKGRLMKRLAALGLQPGAMSAQAGMRTAEHVDAEKTSPQPKRPTKIEKVAATSAEPRSKPEAKKPAAKSTAKKSAPKKTTKK